MKKIIALSIFAMALAGCQPASESTTNTAPAANEPTTGAPAAAPQNEVKTQSFLASFKDMSIEECFVIDDFRERIDKENWGEVLNILKASNAEFKPKGTCCIVAHGEMKKGGATWVAEMILDVDQDAVFGVQYDGENKRIDQFEDDVEGLNTPEPMIEFTKKYNK